MFPYFKKFAGQILTYGLADTINKIIGILIVPLFTRYLSPADYGVAGVLTVTSTLLIGLCDLGLSNGLARFYQDQKDKGKLFTTAQLAMFFSSLAIALAAWLFKDSFSQFFFHSTEYSYITALAFFTVPMTLALTAPMMRLRLEEKARTYAFLNVSRVITGLALNIILIVFLDRGLSGLFEGQLLNAILYFVVVGLYSLKTNGLNFSPALFKKMFFFAYPFVIGLMAFWVMDWADRFILTRLVSLSELGLYNLGYSVGMAIMLPVGAFSTAWVPFYMSVSQQKDASRIYSLVFTYYSLIIGFFVLLIAVFSRDYFYYFTPQEFHEAYVIIPLISLAYAFKGHFTITAVGAFLSRKTIWELITDLISMVLNIAAILILVPYLGRMGAAWATLLAYLALPISMYFLTRKIYYVRYEYARVLQVLVIGLLIYLACFYLYAPNWQSLLIRLVLVLAYPFYFLITRFFHQDELKKLSAIKANLARKVIYEPNE